MIKPFKNEKKKKKKLLFLPPLKLKLGTSYKGATKFHFFFFFFFDRQIRIVLKEGKYTRSKVSLSKGQSTIFSRDS